MNHLTVTRCLAAALVAGAGLSPAAHAATPAELLAGYSAQAGFAAVACPRPAVLHHPPRPANGAARRATAPCPPRPASTPSTGKPIGALAPAFNPERFTDAAKAEKWFRRNCNDVVGRECTAAEKADVLSWLLTLKP